MRIEDDAVQSASLLGENRYGDKAIEPEQRAEAAAAAVQFILPLPPSSFRPRDAAQLCSALHIFQPSALAGELATVRLLLAGPGPRLNRVAREEIVRS